MDIRSAEFWDTAALGKDARRFFESCDGCRRCFNLCPSFEFLFSQIDQSDGRVQNLFPADFNRVVDLCYYCKLCFNHCPYSPPHEYQLDFPLLMFRTKAIRAQESKPSLRDRLLVNTDFIGSWGCRTAKMNRWFLNQRWIRSFLHRFWGIHKDRRLPEFSPRTFRDGVAGRLLPSVGTPKPGNGRTQQPRVALFYTCSVNYHYPEIGEAAVRVLKRNGVEVILPDQVCCGMPFVDIGDIPSILKKAERNIRSLKQAIDRGYDVVAVMPSCSLMLKKEFPSLLGDEDSKEVSRHTYDLCEYLMKLHDAGNLSLDFKSAMGKIIYQVPCHLRDQNIGYKSRDLMQLIPGTSVEIIERCSGHDGTWGIKTEYFEESMKIAGRIFRKVEETAPDRVTTDCPLAGNQITQGTGHEVLHPVQILAMAYGEQEI